METLKTTMGKNNNSLLNKIDTKIEKIFLEIQTYMMKSTTELVQSLKANQQIPKTMLKDCNKYMMKRPTRSLDQTQTTIIQHKSIDQTLSQILSTPITHHR